MNYITSFFFYGLCFCYVTKKSLPNPKSQRFSRIFSWYFIVLGFIFRTTIHLGLICVYDTRYWSRFIFFAYGLFQHRFWKSLFFHWAAFEYLSKTMDYTGEDVFLDSWFFFFNRYHPVLLSNFILSWNHAMWVLQLCSFTKFCWLF